MAKSGDGRLVLTNFDGCVVGYPLPEWEIIEERFSSQPKVPSKKVRNFQRFFLGGAQEVSLDRQGRVLVPPSLREYAGLNKDVILVGVGSKFEIWDKDRHDDVVDQDFDDIAADISEASLDIVL